MYWARFCWGSIRRTHYSRSFYTPIPTLSNNLQIHSYHSLSNHISQSEKRQQLFLLFRFQSMSVPEKQGIVLCFVFLPCRSHSRTPPQQTNYHSKSFFFFFGSFSSPPALSEHIRNDWEETWTWRPLWWVCGFIFLSLPPVPFCTYEESQFHMRSAASSILMVFISSSPFLMSLSAVILDDVYWSRDWN